MAYDGKIMRLALQKFEADRQARQDRFQQRRESIFDREPRLKAVDARLSSTASRTQSFAFPKASSASRRVTSSLEIFPVLIRSFRAFCPIFRSIYLLPFARTPENKESCTQRYNFQKTLHLWMRAIPVIVNIS